jgi:hypothetical protein
MKIKIVSRWNSKKILLETYAESIGAAIAAAMAISANLCDANLRDANLCGANLRDADLRGANLCGADLRDANLRDANLCGANLRGANLCGANLCGANLCGADLRDADLRGADLRGANLCGADLRGADLRDADLRGADLRGANLRDADLRGANLRDANLRDAKNITKSELLKLVQTRTILPDGDLIGWKKLQGGIICKLKIPADAARVGGLVGRKCRAEFAIVLSGEGSSQHNGMVYQSGKTVKPDKFDPNPLVDCSHGIHFFITEQEAKDY